MPAIISNCIMLYIHVIAIIIIKEFLTDAVGIDAIQHYVSIKNPTSQLNIKEQIVTLNKYQSFYSDT